MRLIKILLGIACLSLLSFVNDPAAARIYYVRTQMVFNQPDSTIEVYFFSDWNCDKCKELNNALLQNAGSLQQKAKIYFVDLNPNKDPILTKINEAFLFNTTKELGPYLKVRQKLFELANQNPHPTEEEIKSILSTQNMNVQMLDDQLLQEGINFYNLMKNNFQIKQTPSALVYNLKNRKNQKLEGEALTIKSLNDAILGVQDLQNQTVN